MQQGVTLTRVEVGDHAHRAATTSVGPASRARSVGAGMRPSQVPVGPGLGTRRRWAVGSGAWARPGLVVGPTDDPLEHAADRAATRALTNPSSERRSRGKALAHPGGATAECAAVEVKPSSCSAGGAATPPWSTTLLRWTSSDSSALTSTDSSLRDRAVVSPVAAAALLLERSSHHDRRRAPLARC
jgi:hypothetical protein